jgi:hypothetical protein
MKWFFLLVTMLIPATLWAHEVQYEIEPNRATSIKVHFSDGESLSYKEFEIYSPNDPNIPYQKGRTDRSGYLSFVADTDGTWRVRVIDESGHGLDTEVEIKQAAAIGAGDRQDILTWLRPVIGALVIAAIFGGIYLTAARRVKKT